MQVSKINMLKTKNKTEQQQHSLPYIDMFCEYVFTFFHFEMKATSPLSCFLKVQNNVVALSINLVITPPVLENCIRPFGSDLRSMDLLALLPRAQLLKG